VTGFCENGNEYYGSETDADFLDWMSNYRFFAKESAPWLKLGCCLNILYLLISNFRRVHYVVCFLLDNFPASEFYMPTISSQTLSHIYTPTILKFSHY
jgi:hypothetical protein